MATKPYFLWGDTHAASAAASDTDVLASVFGSGAPETALLATAAGDAAEVSPQLGAAAAAAAVARPRLRRNSSGSGSGKQPLQQAGGGGTRKPPQRGLGVAELERLRCGGDPLRELSAVVVDAAGAQGHPLLHYHPHHHLQMPPSAFEATTAGRYRSQLLAPAPPAPPSPVCFLHPPPPAAGCQRAPLVAPEQQYFRDRWGRMGGFFPAVQGSGGCAEHQPQLLPAPEHPSSQNTIWRSAVPSSSSCLHTGHRCDFCCRRMRALAERGALAPTPPASPNTGANTNTNTMSDYSIYDLAVAMATARQGDAFLALERKGGAAAAEALAKKEVREIEFFPAASSHHTGGGVRFSSTPDESELAAPFSSPYGAAAGRTTPQLDLSLRL